MERSGFEFTGSGRVDRVDTYTTKNGKQIVTVVVQVEGQYPKLVPIKFFGRTADDAAGLQRGDVIEASGHLGGRDWNGKVYGDIEGERFEVVAEASSTRGEQQSMPDTGGAGKHRDVNASDSLPSGRWGSPPPSDDDIPF